MVESTWLTTFLKKISETARAVPLTFIGKSDKVKIRKIFPPNFPGRCFKKSEPLLIFWKFSPTLQKGEGREETMFLLLCFIFSKNYFLEVCKVSYTSI